MLKFHRSAALILACTATLGLTACASGGGKRDTAYIARDVNTLYASAQRTMQAGDYDQAAKLFDEVERQHPYSIWARRAQLMSAFNYYLAHKYNDAISTPCFRPATRPEPTDLAKRRWAPSSRTRSRAERGGQ
jgi:outer membrane protein assembly factor BamD